MEIRIIVTSEEYEELEALTQELRRLLLIDEEVDLPRRKGPGKRRYIKARINKPKSSSRSQQN